MYDQWDVGEVATLRIEALNSSGNLANPTSLDLTVTDPSGNVTSVAIGGLTAVSTGVYTYALTVDEAGIWTYQWVAAGNGVAFTTTEYVIVGQSTVGTGPCDLWITPTQVFDLHPYSTIASGDRDMALADLAAQAASRILFALSRERYPGICRHVVRPCRQSDCWIPPSSYLWSDSWGWCGCGAATPMQCGCGSLSEIELGAAPVIGVTEVLVDGDVVPRASYRVDDHRWLVRLDGSSWPYCQDLTLATTEVGTFQVTFFAGRTPPADGVLAAKRMAGDLYQGMTGVDCVAPANLVSRTRQGDTIELSAINEATDLAAGWTALTEVNAFLQAERYGRANARATTVSVDSMAAVRR